LRIDFLLQTRGRIGPSGPVLSSGPLGSGHCLKYNIVIHNTIYKGSLKGKGDGVSQKVKVKDKD
jgi:hypothetical protein